MILYGYVIMSNHIHLVIQSEEGKLSDLIRDLKAFLARKIIKIIQIGPGSRSDWMLKRFEFAAKTNMRNEKNHGATTRFWSYGNHSEEIFSEKFFWTKLNRAAFRYIHMNPDRAKIVLLASDYLYSSASNYVGKKSIFSGILLMDNPIIDSVKNDWTKDIDNW